MKTTQRPRILIAGDNPRARTATRLVLEAAEFDVQESGTAADALEACRKHAPDVALVEVQLEDMPGCELCRHLRNDAATAGVSLVLVWTASVRDADRAPALESGADAFLTYPVDPALLVGTLRSILRARTARRDVAESEAHFRAMFERALHGICLLDQKMNFLEVNPAMCAMLARSREELIGMSTRDFAYEELDAALAQRGEWRGTLPHVADDGRLQLLEWHVTHHSTPGVRLALVTDVTERRVDDESRERMLDTERAARAAAERSERGKDDLLGALTHELRSPLNAIVGWTHLLEHAAPGSAEWAKGLEVIKRNAQAQTQLISDMQDLARIASGKLVLSVQRLDLPALVRAAVEGARAVAAPKKVVLELREPAADGAEVEPIPGDRARIRQALDSLLHNAIRASSTGGRVEATLARVDDGFEFEVVDHGCGLAPESVPHAFDHLHQAGEGATRTAGSVGLGLAIAKELVLLHGGSVRATSPGLGQGATFALRLPDAQHSTLSVPLNGGAARREPHEAVDLSGTRILVVDDDGDARAFVCRILGEHGAVVRDAGDVDSALDVIESFAPRVLISDIGMPMQDGYDLMRKVRLPGLAAIALTAYARDDDRKRALDAGFQLHLPKPIDPQMLLEAVHSVAAVPQG